MGRQSEAIIINHFSHHHPLHLTNPQPSRICSTCMQTLETEPFYTCKLPSCNTFSLHLKCSQLPQRITHPCHHHHHPLSLLPKSRNPNGVFACNACGNDGHGFSYNCKDCGVYIHVGCATLPLSLSHRSHGHQLNLVFSSPYRTNGFSCDVCGVIEGRKCWLYRCSSCGFDAHLSCATSKTEAVSRVGNSTYQEVFLNQMNNQRNQIQQAMMMGYGDVNNQFLQTVIGGGGSLNNQILQAIMGDGGGGGSNQLLQTIMGGGGGGGGGGDLNNQILQALMGGGGGGGGGGGSNQLLQTIMGGGGGGGGDLNNQILQAIMGGGGGGGGGGGSNQLLQTIMGGGGGGGGDLNNQILQAIMGGGGSGGGGSNQLLQTIIGSGGGGGGDLIQSLLNGSNGGFDLSSVLGNVGDLGGLMGAGFGGFGI